MGYPIMARLANLPVEIRNGQGYGGSYIVGWLPIIEGNEEEKGDKEFVDFKRVIWHDSFRHLFKTLKKYAKDGGHIKCGDGVKRHLFPVVLILSADYEEQSIMAAIRGFRGLKPCTICLVPSNEQHLITKQFTTRTQEETKFIVDSSATMPPSEAEENLKSHGLHPIQNAFWDLSHSDPHQALSFDRMHNNAHGVGGKHLWPLIQKYTEQLPRESRKAIDDRAAAMPRWRGLPHFGKILNVHFTDATKFEDIMKISLFLIHNLFALQLGKEGYILLQLIRRYINIDMYSSLEVQTEDTISNGKAEVAAYNKFLQLYIAETPNAKKNWDFPKNHMLGHIFYDIMQKGVTRNSNTQPSEQKHRSIKAAYQRTNFKNIESQILQATTVQEAMSMIRAAVSHAEDDELELSPQLTPHTALECGRIHLGAPGHLISFTLAKTENPNDHYYQKLVDEANDFLIRNLDIAKYPVPQPSGRYLKPSAQFREYAFMKVFYSSLVDWREAVDYLRCSPSFNNQPRYDSVIYKADGHDIFGKLQKIFAINVSGEDIPLCLVRPYSFPRGRALKKDVDLQLIRCNLQPQEEYEVIFAHSIVHGAVLLPSHDQPSVPGSHIVFDMLDVVPDSEDETREVSEPDITLGWTTPSLPSRPTHSNYRDVIAACEIRIRELEHAVSGYRSNNANLHRLVSKNANAQPQPQAIAVVPVDNVDKALRDHISLIAKRFTVMNEIYVADDAFPDGGVEDLASLIDPDDAVLRYRNGPANKLKGCIAELYREVPADLHHMMKRNPKFATSYFNPAAGSIRRSSVNSVIKTLAPAVFPELVKYRNVDLDDRSEILYFSKALKFDDEDDFLSKCFPLHYEKGIKNPEKFLQRKALAEMLRGILFGPASLKANCRKGKKTNGVLWKVKRITPGAIAYVGVLAIYAHSWDAQFEEKGRRTGFPYKDYFDHYKGMVMANFGAGDTSTIDFYNEHVLGKFKEDGTDSDSDSSSDGENNDSDWEGGLTTQARAAVLVADSPGQPRLPANRTSDMQDNSQPLSQPQFSTTSSTSVIPARQSNPPSLAESHSFSESHTAISSNSAPQRSPSLSDFQPPARQAALSPATPSAATPSSSAHANPEPEIEAQVPAQKRRGGRKAQPQARGKRPTTRSQQG
ncbi:hypothetical protein NP233_g11364 [Leucocoprinus birnbaumii]|uniref:Uncharacterized protein n=1 Tax=Leucocoprinus birnbaumii TaxID=56174 RepID=A0AAD5VGY1_9AGAR|nr:hypothetical protein NP233_g11364 [Leucocoprinus birnbaumii]